MDILQQTSSFAVFMALAIAGVIVLVGGMLFGAGHDLGHDLIHEMGHHGGSHGGDGHHDQPISIFSIKIIATFVMAFGAAGSIATYLGLSPLVSSLIGVAAGVAVGFLVLIGLRSLYANQSEPEPSSASVAGKIGIVTTQIDPGQLGEVEVSVGMGRRAYRARSAVRRSISPGTRVKVVEVNGTEIFVEVA